MSTQQVEKYERLSHLTGRTPSKKQFLNNEVLFNNNPAEEELFDRDILETVRLQDSAPKLPANLCMRPLQLDDWKKGYLELLQQLTTVGDVTEIEFKQRFQTMRGSNPQMYYVVVLEDTLAHRIIATITLVIEFKFIHAAGCRGRVEDLVVDTESRGKKLGQLLNFYVIELARLLGVYKLSLECKDSLITFYEQFGFIKDPGNNFMVQRFDGIPLC